MGLVEVPQVLDDLVASDADRDDGANAGELVYKLYVCPLEWIEGGLSGLCVAGMSLAISSCALRHFQALIHCTSKLN